MDWHFPKSDLAGEVNLASYSRTIIEGERTISGLEIFVREVLQNSLAAAVRIDGIAQKVVVRLRLRTLPVGTRTSINRALSWDRLKQHLLAANRVSERRMDRYQFPDPNKLDGRQMQILEIHEHNTIGLIGPDRIDREEDERPNFSGVPKAYRALCRDDARREKVSLGSGGTFGLGKAVLWRASAIQTVLFFSRLSIAASGATFRAAAQARLCNHYLATQQYRGLGFGGTMRGEFCAPLCDSEAIQFAQALDIDPRPNASDLGTTIIIPFWEPPAAKVDDRDVDITALLARYAARYFWPAIVENRLEVSVTDGTRTADARDHLAKYNSFIQLYGRVRTDEQAAQDAPPEKINFVVPPGPPPLEYKEAHTFLRCGLMFIDPENPEQRVSDDLLERVAEVRGQGMVIGYQRLTGRARVRPFVGLALGGRIGDERQAGLRGDMLLGYSEHVTHTRWDEEADALGSWPEARPRVRSLLEKTRAYFERNAGVEPPRTNADLSALQYGLRFPGVQDRGPDPPPPPPPGVPHLSKRSFEHRDNRYTFEIRARVEPGKRPARLDIWIEAGIETGRPSKEDRLRIDDIKTTPGGLPVERLGDGKVRIEIPTYDQPMQVRVSGSTESLSGELLAVTEGELRAKIEPVDLPEKPDSTPAGERPDAES